MFWVILFVLSSVLCRTALAEFSLSDLPKCSLPCLVEALPVINCTATDFVCQCRHSDEFAQVLQPCLQAKCTMQQTIDLAKLQGNLCKKPTSSRQNYLRWEKIIAVGLELLFVAIRICAKIWIKKKLSMDDWLILVAALLSAASLASVLISVAHGFGLHLWQFDTSYNFAQALKYFYVEQILYAFITGITKLSLIIFFLQIFRSRGFGIAAKIVFASVACSTTVYIFTLSLQCIPVPYTWDKDIAGGKCLHFNNLAYSGAAITIAQDVATLMLPIPQLRTLKIDVYKRIGLIIMFSVGSLGCVASMVRLKFLIDYGISTGQAADPTYTTVPAIAWSGIEASAAIVASCLPTIRLLFRHISSTLSPRLTKTFGSSRSTGYPARLSSFGRNNPRKQVSLPTETGNESEIELGPTRSSVGQERVD